MDKTVPQICTEFIDTGCRETCPLSKACEFRVNDDKESHDKRMQEAANKHNSEVK